MKKSELSVGMRVELANGNPGTVVAVSGWSRGAEQEWSVRQITDPQGRQVEVIGIVGGPDAVVVWDQHTPMGRMPIGSIVSIQSLRPVGTFAAAKAAQDAQEAEDLAFDIKTADTFRGRLRVRYGDATNNLLDALDVPSEGPMNSYHWDRAGAAITCFDIIKGEN